MQHSTFESWKLGSKEMVMAVDLIFPIHQNGEATGNVWCSMFFYAAQKRKCKDSHTPRFVPGHLILSFSEVMVGRLPADWILMDAAASLQRQKDSHTPRFLPGMNILCFFKVTALLWLMWRILGDIHRRREFHTPRFLQAEIAQCFSEVMVVPWLAIMDGIGIHGPTSHPWTRDLCTRRSLQATVMQCFCEVMALPWLADRILQDNVISHLWRRGGHTRRSLRAGNTQSCSEMTDVPWLAEVMAMDNVTSQFWRKQYHTFKFLQGLLVRCLLEVMVLLWLAEVTCNTTFHPRPRQHLGLSGFVASLLHHLQSPGFVMLAATISSLSPRVAIGFCNCNVWMRIFQCWNCPVWLERKCCVWAHIGLIWHRISIDALRRSWRQKFRAFQLFCPTGICWPQRTVQIHWPQLRMSWNLIKSKVIPYVWTVPVLDRSNN